MFALSLTASWHDVLVQCGICDESHMLSADVTDNSLELTPWLCLHKLALCLPAWTGDVFTLQSLSVCHSLIGLTLVILASTVDSRRLPTALTHAYVPESISEFVSDFNIRYPDWGTKSILASLVSSVTLDRLHTSHTTAACQTTHDVTGAHSSLSPTDTHRQRESHVTMSLTASDSGVVDELMNSVKLYS